MSAAGLCRCIEEDCTAEKHCQCPEGGRRDRRLLRKRLRAVLAGEKAEVRMMVINNRVYTSWGWINRTTRQAFVYGIYVNLDEPVTGVANANHLDYIWDGDQIDLAWDEHSRECKNEYHDSCGPFESGDLLLGSWAWSEEGECWEPDENAKDAEWAAIYRQNSNVLQVVWSKHTRRCVPCSPCYPGQGDLDSPDEDGLLAYDVPPWAREKS